MTTENKILIVGPAWVGDMVMAQTLFILLKHLNPAVILDVVAPAWSGPLLERMPEVRKSFVLGIGHGSLDLKERWRTAKQLRLESYDQAILLPNSFKSALLPLWAKIPRRTGWLGEYRYGLLNDIRYLNEEKLPLMIQRFMALGLSKNAKLPHPLPRPTFAIKAEWVEATLEKFGLDAKAKPVLSLCPGAEFGPAKRWPPGYFAEVAAKKLKEGWQVWIFGSGKDQELADIIQKQTQNGCVNLVGKTTLAEAIDLLSTSSAVLSNDSGLMHMAAALNRPLIVMYGSTSPKFTPPLNDQVKILNLQLPCSPCFKRECPLTHLDCLNELKPSMVLQAFDEMIPL